MGEKTVIGIDVGGSTTKIVGFRGSKDRSALIDPIFVRATDPVTATFGAFGKFLQPVFFFFQGVGGAAAVEFFAPNEALVFSAKCLDALFLGHGLFGRLFFGLVAANPAEAERKD